MGGGMKKLLGFLMVGLAFTAFQVGAASADVREVTTRRVV